MRILMLSTDEKVFDRDSAVAKRLVDYGNLFDRLDVIAYTKKSGKFSFAKLSEKVFIHPTNTWFKPFYFWDAYEIGASILKRSNLPKEVRPLKDWVITAQDPFETAVVGYFLKKKYKIPLQIQSHSDFLSPFFAAESWKNRLRVVLGRWLIKKADGIRVVSTRVKNSLITNCQLPGNRITVLPIIYDMDRFRNQPITTDLHKKYSNHDFIILVASRFTVEKNIAMAIEAFASVKRHVSGVKSPLLLMVGDGPNLESLKLLVKSYKLEGSVIFEPWTSDLVSYYRTADIFVLTSNYEGGARAPAEAVAAGLPVVMTDVAPANETVKDNINGFVVPIGDWSRLSERILNLLSDKNKRAAFSLAALDIAKNFPTKNEYLKRYRESLTNLLSGGIL